MRRKRKGLGRDYWIATETELWYFFTIAKDPLQRGFTISVYDLVIQPYTCTEDRMVQFHFTNAYVWFW